MRAGRIKIESRVWNTVRFVNRFIRMSFRYAEAEVLHVVAMASFAIVFSEITAGEYFATGSSTRGSRVVNHRSKNFPRNPSTWNTAAGAPRAKATNSSWWRFALVRFYESLTLEDEVRAADLIFVMAGRMERKQYGLDLFRAGVAPKLLLSVGRFEVRKMRKLDLEGLDELIRLREQTPPDERHFFIKVEPSGVRIEKARLPQWSTYGEALALRHHLEMDCGEHGCPPAPGGFGAG